MTRLRRACTAVVAVLIAVSPAASSAGPAPTRPARPARPAKVVLFSLPGVTWADVERAGAMPNMRAFAKQAAIANMSVRTAAPATALEDGYATIGAGNRASGGASGALMFDRDAPFEGAAACDTYERRTGRACGGSVVHLGIASVVRDNRALPYDAVPGAIGDSLARAGRGTAVIANADGPTASQTPLPVLRRGAGMSVMDRDGLVPSGDVSEALLTADARAPYGVRMSAVEVAARFRKYMQTADVVAVEASDLDRADRAAPQAMPAPATWDRIQALQDADGLMGILLAAAPLRDTMWIVVSPAAPGTTNQLTVFAAAGPGVAPGTAVSASTRRPGVVTLPDVAPTILGALGVKIPPSMTGSGIGSTRPQASLASLVRMNAQSVRRDALTGPVIVVFVLGLVALYTAAGVMLWRRAASLPFAFLAVWATLLPLSMFMLRLFPFQGWSTAVSVIAVYGLALVLASACWATRRVWICAPIALAAAVTLTVLLADLVLGSPLEFDSPLGYSPVVAGRFSGAGNLGFSVIFCTATFVAVFVVIRWGRRPWPLAACAALFTVVVAIDGSPAWGADVGGVLAGVPAFTVTWLLLAGRRVNARAVVWAVCALAAAVAMFTLIDLSRASQDQTHLAHLVEAIAGTGSSAFVTILQRKLAANLAILTSSVFVLLLPFTIAFLVVLTYQQRGLRVVMRRRPTLRRGLLGLFVTGVLGMLLNDSGIAIPAMMLGTVAPVLLYMRAVEDSDTAAGEMARGVAA